MEQGCFAIEHEKTRLSLKDAFEELFAKYDREFEEEDEIDILNLKVVRKGGFLSKSRIQEFGECYRKRTKRSTESLSEEDESSDHIDNQVLDQVCKSIKKTRVALRQDNLLSHKKHFSPFTVLSEPMELRWDGHQAFDTALYSMIKDECKEEQRLEDEISQVYDCHCKTCFNCVLLKEIFK